MNVVDYHIRGGAHPNPRIDNMEKAIAQNALKLYFSSPIYTKKGLKWCYNWIHFASIYSHRDKEVLEYLFENTPYPDYIEVETTTFCNMRCHLCEHTYWNENNMHMTLDEFKKIISYFPTLKWIGLTGIGQSWLNPDYMKMMEFVKQKDPAIFIENFDNFLFIDKERSKRMIEIGVDKIYVSLDAANKETYEKVQAGSNWDRVMKNIKDFDDAKKEVNSYWPELWFHFIVTKENINEMEEYLQMIHDLDVKVTRIQFTKLLHNFKEIEDQYVEISDELKNKIIKKGQELGLEVSWNMNSASCKDTLDKCSVWMQPFIFADGTVIPCCSMNEQNAREWQKETRLGNVLETDFRKIWYGEKYQNMINSIKQNKPCSQCARCVLFEQAK